MCNKNIFSEFHVELNFNVFIIRERTLAISPRRFVRTQYYCFFFSYKISKNNNNNNNTLFKKNINEFFFLMKNVVQNDLIYKQKSIRLFSIREENL